MTLNLPFFAGGLSLGFFCWFIGSMVSRVFVVFKGAIMLR